MSTDYDEGTPLPAGTEIYESADGLRYAVIDGEAYIETDDGDFWHASYFEPDDAEPDATDEVPAWAKPLLERHAADQAATYEQDVERAAEAKLEEDEAPLVEWLRERPHLLEDLEKFQLAVDKADGDIELGERYYNDARATHEDDLDRARLHENVAQPTSISAGLDEWMSEKREAKRAEAEAAVTPYKHDPIRGDDPMAEAMNSFVDDLHVRNETDRRSRELVREQERRDR
jgi:hypothetical protein